jgi:hypothetical protein
LPSRGIVANEGRNDKEIHVKLNAVGPRWDAAAPSGQPGYEKAREGLRVFDSIADEVRRRQDGLAYPRPASAGGLARGIGGALSAYLASEAGRRALHALASAGLEYARKAMDHGPEQLPLPLG